MARDQVLRWSMDHPTCPKTGHYFEVPLSHTLPRVAAVMGLAGVVWYAIPHFLWYKKPESFVNPEFIAEAKAIGNVAVRRVMTHECKHHGSILSPIFVFPLIFAATYECASCIP